MILQYQNKTFIKLPFFYYHLIRHKLWVTLVRSTNNSRIRSSVSAAAFQQHTILVIQRWIKSPVLALCDTSANRCWNIRNCLFIHLWNQIQKFFTTILPRACPNSPNQVDEFRNILYCIDGNKAHKDKMLLKKIERQL